LPVLLLSSKIRSGFSNSHHQFGNGLTVSACSPEHGEIPAQAPLVDLVPVSTDAESAHLNDGIHSKLNLDSYSTFFG
jgi:hypothetical protein